MKTFRCDKCGHPLFFENVQCLQCGSDLAFLPDALALAPVEPVPGADGLWWRKVRRRIKSDSTRKSDESRYRLCLNHTQHQACNFAVPEHDPNALCVSCRQTRVLPDLSVEGNHERWYRIEVAKRRLFYNLARLGLVAIDPPAGIRDGPVYEFLADTPAQRVMTGHVEGVITLNIAEADDAERVKRRIEMREPYRTLLGHLRHESGHFYWEPLVDDGGPIEEFRRLFGDERQDYAGALRQHYASGGSPAGWQASFVSAYATSHPWEDWAETWAHYLHMVDLLETASSYRTKISVPGEEEIEHVSSPYQAHNDFNDLVEQWIPLTLLVNSMNRSLGQDDAYPFALSQPALDKLRFVHDVIDAHRA